MRCMHDPRHNGFSLRKSTKLRLRINISGSGPQNFASLLEAKEAHHTSDLFGTRGRPSLFTVHPMSMLTYNIHSGNLEAIVHGWKSALLRAEDYHNFTQCDNLDDMRMHLSGSEYGTFLQNEARLTPQVIFSKAEEKLVADFFDLRDNAVEPLAKFLDFISVEYMILNVLKLIAGACNGRDTVELLYICHPLGMFDGMAALTAATSVDELWALLADTPLGPFFERFTEREDFDEQSLDYIRALLYRNYIEAFHDYCVDDIGGLTGEVMGNLLGMEADRATVSAVRTTYGSKLVKEERQRLFPRIGCLVDLHEDLSACDDDDALKDKLRPFGELAAVVESSSAGGEGQQKEMDRKFAELLIEMHKSSLARQMHFGAFYSLYKLREFECRNLQWIAECIVFNKKDRISAYTPLY